MIDPLVADPAETVRSLLQGLEEDNARLRKAELLVGELLAALKELADVAEAEWGWMREEDPCPELCAIAQCHNHGCVPMKLDAAKALIAKAEAR